MDPLYTYHSISEPAEGLYKEKGSRFIAYAFPVNNEEKIKEHLQQLRKKHFDARHHCYAFRLGADGKHYRANDDQEPAGSAGKPIHGQLLSFNVTNILLVVVRYFGGTKLGVGGLIQAYKAAAEDCLNHASIKEYPIEKSIHCEFPYEKYNEVMKHLRDCQFRDQTQHIDEQCVLEGTIPLRNESSLIQKFERLSGLTYRIEEYQP